MTPIVTSADPDYEAVLARFTGLVQRGRPAEDKVDIERVVLEVVSAASQRLRSYGVESRIVRSGTALEIVPGSANELSNLASEVERSGGKLQYDVQFFVRQPYASASFDRDARTLLLPHSAIEKIRIDDPTRHEMVHLEIWSELGRRVPSPYYGFLRGKAFQPNDLYLDEMKAYEHDLVAAGGLLKALLDKAGSAAEFLAHSDLDRVWKARAVNQRPEKPLTPLEEAYDRVLSKAIFGGFHSMPAVESLYILAKAAADPTQVRYATVREGVQASVDGTSASPQQAALKGIFYLVASHGPGDPKNAALLGDQIRWGHKAAVQHSERFEATRRAARDAAEPQEPGERMETLRALAAISMRALPAP